MAQTLDRTLTLDGGRARSWRGAGRRRRDASAPAPRGRRCRVRRPRSPGDARHRRCAAGRKPRRDWSVLPHDPAVGGLPIRDARRDHLVARGAALPWFPEPQRHHFPELFARRPQRLKACQTQSEGCLDFVKRGCQRRRSDPLDEGSTCRPKRSCRGEGAKYAGAIRGKLGGVHVADRAHKRNECLESDASVTKHRRDSVLNDHRGCCCSS